MLGVHELQKTYGARTLFEGVTFQLNKKCRYGIVGANGSGKSTLLRILTSEEEASSGTVQIPKKIRLGVLAQDHFEYENTRILDVVMMGHASLWAAITERDAILAKAHEYFDGDRFAELEEIIERDDGYNLESRAASVLEGLNIPAEVHDSPLSVLSGGFKLRVLLAQVLAANPDALLLDEPTNHLDILSIRWLEKFLENYEGCAVVVSHDHRFLNNVCSHIIDVDYERATLYTGNYDAFVEAKQSHRDRLEAEIKKREKEISDQKQFIERFKAKATKARQAQSRVKRVAKMVIEKLPESSRRYPMFKFEAQRQSGRKVLELEGISKIYGEKIVLEDVSFQVNRGDRIAIIGPNGIGKSTLLKIAMEGVIPDDGAFEWGYETHVGYFAQDHHEVVGTGPDTVESWLWDRCPMKPVGFVKGKLAEVLFGKDDVGKLITALSGGEAARLVFSSISVERPNVLVLDEPTNHLDLEGIAALADALKNYDGTVIFVSHDRWFVSKLATRIIELRPDGIEDYPGTYVEYLNHCGDDHLDADAVVNKAKKDKREARKTKGGRQR
jgi:ATPase subunit of ABC transporter with duplicated ATPase domains